MHITIITIGLRKAVMVSIIITFVGPPMGILMSAFLKELRVLYNCVLNSTYYWLHKDMSYLRLVYCNPITDAIIDEVVDKKAFEYENKYLKSESDFQEYIIEFIDNIES